MKTLISQNTFLCTLPLPIREAAEPALELVELRKNLFSPNPNITDDFLYFPLSCLFSLDMRMGDGFQAHLALLGYRDVAGLHRLMSPPLPAATRVLASGYALRMSVATFEAQVRNSTDLRLAVQGNLSTLMCALSFATACNLHHPLQKRLCRWLLAAMDATAQESFELTHEELACLLGVRREAVTESLARLSQAGAIETTRGKVRVKDGNILADSACECIRATAIPSRKIVGTSVRSGAPYSVTI